MQQTPLKKKKSLKTQQFGCGFNCEKVNMTPNAY